MCTSGVRSIGFFVGSNAFKIDLRFVVCKSVFVEASREQGDAPTIYALFAEIAVPLRIADSPHRA